MSRREEIEAKIASWHRNIGRFNNSTSEERAEFNALQEELALVTGAALPADPQPAQELRERTPVNDWPYAQTFGAIAAATRIEAGAIAVSIEAFAEAFGPFPHLATPASGARPQCRICGQWLNRGTIASRNCGGDCLQCMAEVGEDPDCIAALLALAPPVEPPGPASTDEAKDVRAEAEELVGNILSDYHRGLHIVEALAAKSLLRTPASDLAATGGVSAEQMTDAEIKRLVEASVKWPAAEYYAKWPLPRLLARLTAERTAREKAEAELYTGETEPDTGERQTWRQRYASTLGSVMMLKTAHAAAQAEAKRLAGALTQVEDISNANTGSGCAHHIALAFVGSVARAALSQTATDARKEGE